MPREQIPIHIKINNKNTRTGRKICSKLKNKEIKTNLQTPGVFTINFEKYAAYLSALAVDFKHLFSNWKYVSNMIARLFFIESLNNLAPWFSLCVCVTDYHM